MVFHLVVVVDGEVVEVGSHLEGEVDFHQVGEVEEIEAEVVGEAVVAGVEEVA